VTTKLTYNECLENLREEKGKNKVNGEGFFSLLKRSWYIIRLVQNILPTNYTLRPYLTPLWELLYYLYYPI